MKHVKHNKIAIDVKFLEQSVAFEHLIKIIDLTILFIYLLIILNSIENPSQARSIILPLFTAVFIFLNHFIPFHSTPFLSWLVWFWSRAFPSCLRQHILWSGRKRKYNYLWMVKLNVAASNDCMILISMCVVIAWAFWLKFMIFIKCNIVQSGISSRDLPWINQHLVNGMLTHTHTHTAQKESWRFCFSVILSVLNMLKPYSDDDWHGSMFSIELCVI